MEKGSFHLDGGIESAAYPAFKVDTMGRICGWNRGCEQIYSYPSSEVLGRSPLVLVSKACRRDFKDTIVRVFKGETVRGKEWKYDAGDGKSYYVLAQVYPIHGLSGQVSECIILNSDMKDLKVKMKQLERYAAESKERLTRLTKEYDLLKSNVASFIRRKT